MNDCGLFDPQTRKPRLLTQQCATCVGRPGNVMDLKPGRLAELVESNKEGLGLICHQTIDYDDDGVPGGPNMAFCRWFYDNYSSNYQRICERIGGFTQVPPPGKDQDNGQGRAAEAPGRADAEAGNG